MRSGSILTAPVALLMEIGATRFTGGTLLNCFGETLMAGEKARLAVGSSQ